MEMCTLIRVPDINKTISFTQLNSALIFGSEETKNETTSPLVSHVFLRFCGSTLGYVATPGLILGMGRNGTVSDLLWTAYEIPCCWSEFLFVEILVIAQMFTLKK